MVLDASPLELAREHLGLSLGDLWLRCLGLGGLFSLFELTASLAGRRPLTAPEFDVVAQALNERFMDDGGDHPLAYADGS
jgi:hypothetical protein